MDLKNGDVVALKSGGPKMTIENINNGNVSCTWYDKDNNLHRDTFNEKALDICEGSIYDVFTNN